MVILREKEAEEFYKFIFKINQDLKKQPIGVPKKKPFYIISGLNYYMFDYDLYLSQSYGTLKPRGVALQVFKEHGEDIQFLMDSDGYFQFDKAMKAAKVEIEEIIIKDNKITINTTHPEVTLDSESINDHYGGSLDKYREFLSRVREIENSKTLIESKEDDLSELKAEEWKKSFQLFFNPDDPSIPIKSFLDRPESSNMVSITLRPRDIINKNKSTKMHVEVKKDNRFDSNMYVVIELKTTNYDGKFVFRIVF